MRVDRGTTPSTAPVEASQSVEIVDRLFRCAPRWAAVSRTSTDPDLKGRTPCPNPHGRARGHDRLRRARSAPPATACCAGRPRRPPLTEDRRVTGTQGLQGHVHDRALHAQGRQALLRRHAQGHDAQERQDEVTKENVRHARRRRRRRPARLAPGAAAAAAAAPPATPARSSPSTLGPINLNLLGLVVRTNQIQLRIDAVPGAGNLLGNLLCAVTGLLNPTGALGQLTGALNQLAAALNAILRARRRRAPRPAPPPSQDASPHAAAGCPRGTLRPAWSSSPASSPRDASTSATTSAASCSTSPARTAATRRSTASSTCTRSRSTTTRRSCASAPTTCSRCSSPPAWIPSARSCSARATSRSTPS